MNTSNLAIAIPVHIPSAVSPRLGYFQQHLHHLSLAARHWPVHFFIDGGDVQVTIDNIHSAHLPNSHIHINPTRLGLGLNIHHARKHLFDTGHDLVMLVESDVLITHDFITLCSHILDWSRASGWWPAISGSAHVSYSPDPQHVIYHLMSWCNYLMPLEAYQMMQPGFDEYATFLHGVDYQQRPHHAIQDWLRTRYAMPAESTFQDNINRVLAYKLGIHYWTLARNRAIHIGEHGEHFTPETFIAHGDHTATLQPHHDDTRQGIFKPHGLNPPPVARS